MASIPKRITDRFIKTLPKFQKVLQIAKDRDVNESDTVSILNDIISEIFGYDKYLEITSEFAIRNTYCDLALKVDEKVEFIVEAKAIGIGLKDTHMKQACDYGANHGVQWIILTNGITWKIYRIRFEQPVNYDLVQTFKFTSINPHNEIDRQILFMLSKEGLAKNAREDFFEKVQSVNRFVIGQLLLSDSVTNLIRREIRKFADGIKVDTKEITKIIQNQIIKREVLEGDRAESAYKRISKFYRKNCSHKKKNPKNNEPKPEEKVIQQESVTERLLREAGEQNNG